MTDNFIKNNDIPLKDEEVSVERCIPKSALCAGF
jgi:hypothetical protein